MTVEVSVRRSEWTELDLLRALAGALMVVNHAGAAWLVPDDASPGDRALVFAGGLAPVLFFAATGVGRGLQARGVGTHAPPARELAPKLLVLLLADAAMWLPHRSFGMDFLGFIALSTVATELVRRSAHPERVAALGGVACLSLRFGVAPWLALPQGDGAALAGLHWVLGDVETRGFSYPLCPWLALPLAGQLAGAYAASHAAHWQRCRMQLARILGVLATLGALACGALAWRGMVFFRWGTMSFAYFVLAATALLAALALSLAAAHHSGARLTRALSLSGASAFVLVPIHYLIVALGHVGAIDLARAAFPLLALATVLLAVVTSKLLAQQLTRAADLVRSRARVALVFLALLALLGLQTRVEGRLPGAAAQLLAAVLFVLRTPRRRAVPVTVHPDLPLDARGALTSPRC